MQLNYCNTTLLYNSHSNATQLCQDRIFRNCNWPTKIYVNRNIQTYKQKTLDRASDGGYGGGGGFDCSRLKKAGKILTIMKHLHFHIWNSTFVIHLLKIASPVQN